MPPMNAQSLFHTETLGHGPVRFIWGHGWGQSLSALYPLAQSLTAHGEHILIDFPGFGQSAEPPEAWDTAAYADAVAAWIKTLPAAEKTIWCGHSFGGRVGLRLAARHPGLFDGFVLIAAHGLKPVRPWHAQLRIKGKIALYKTAKAITGFLNIPLPAAFGGSADYRATSGLMRQIFIKTVNEDQSAAVKTIAKPVMLIYGGKDDQTPPALGQRLKALIPDAQLHILNNEDHYTLLSSGRHQVAHLIQDFGKPLS